MAAFSPSLVVMARFTPTERPEVLQDRFGCRGVTFKRCKSSGKLLLELKLRCGTKTQISVPDATVKSYRPIMWHEGPEEMLHVQETMAPSSAPGGLSTSFVLEGRDSEPQDVDLYWKIEDVAMNRNEFAKVNLKAGHGNLALTYTLNITKDVLSIELTVENLDNVPAAFKSSIMAQFSVSSIQGSYAVGLLGNKYLKLANATAKAYEKEDMDRSPRVFAWLAKVLGGQSYVIPTDDDAKEDDTVLGKDGKLWYIQGQEMASMASGMDHLYAISSQLWTIVDRGKRRSLSFRKEGFPYYRLSNPGPGSRFIDWDELITIGPTTGDKSIVLQPGQQWKGAQILNNTRDSR